MMRILSKATFAFISVLFSLTAQAQLDALFAPFDCRTHAELFHTVVEIPKRLVLPDSAKSVETETVVFVDPADAWKTWSFVGNYSFGKDRGAMPMITDINALHPYFRDKIRELIIQCKALGIELAVVESYRTHAKQSEYKGMGRKYTSSGAGRSKHQYGLAVDVVPIIDSVAVWDNTAVWKKIGAAGEKLGLRWGGRWRRPFDPGHFEWTGGLTSYYLAQGLLPVVPMKDYPCLEEDIRFLREYWKEWETSQSAWTRK